ncbi:MAG: nitroreductase family protein [Candidatus Njordarchaeia archaeon]
MGGIIFYATRNLAEVTEFYLNKLNMSIWLKQKDCIILKHGNMLLGFCQREKIDTNGIITFIFEEKDEVDDMYKKLREIATSKPKVNEKYGIYHFFARDPDGRVIELQHFLHKVEPVTIGDELLVTRRSIREFKSEKIPDDVLWKIFELCRYSPTSKNSQSYYFVVIRNRELLEFLSSLRGLSSSPIGRAPMAVAICSDPNKTKRPFEDACIAAYHFMLAAWTYGLGTCWIADMNRDVVKERLGIPKDHYIATVTPLGYPKYVPGIPERREAKEFVTFLD